MKFTFSGEGEFVILDIDRKNEKAKISSTNTNYQLVGVEWNQLFDKGKEQKQIEDARKLSDDEFKNLFATQMMIYGYKLVSFENAN